MTTGLMEEVNVNLVDPSDEIGLTKPTSFELTEYDKIVDNVDLDLARYLIQDQGLHRLTSNCYVRLDRKNEPEVMLEQVGDNNFQVTYYDPSLTTKLNEVKRAKIIGRSKRDDNFDRFKRRLTIQDGEIRYYSVDIQEFLKTGSLVFRFAVRSYDVSIQVDGLIEYLNKKLKGIVNYNNVRKFLNMAIDRSDIKVDCTCPDFRYRFAYTATQRRFKAGRPETRPSKIRNPKMKGSGCKHIMKLLNNKQWIYKYVTLINLLLKLNPDTLDKFKNGTLL